MPDGGLHHDGDGITGLRLTLLANGFAPIPVTAPEHRSASDPGKAPLLPNWQKVSADTLTTEVVKSWARRPAETNTGLVCGQLVVLDIDTPVEQLAARLRDTAFALLGPTPFVRIGRAPKVALLYRLREPAKKQTTPALFLPGGIKLQVEILGAGQQMVAFGIHPATGQPYAWPDASPATHAFTSVPETTAELLQAYCASAEAMIRSAGAMPEAAGEERQAAVLQSKYSDRKPGYRHPFGIDTGIDFPPPTREEVEEALSAVPNAHDWEGWVKIGAALHDALGDDEEDLFVAWSAQSQKDDPPATRRKWKSFSTSPMETSASTLFWEARRNGWKPKRERVHPDATTQASQDESEDFEPQSGRRESADAAGADQGSESEEGELTEHHVARAFACRHASDLRYCHTAGAWYAWTGAHWAKNTTRLAFDQARALADEMSRGAPSRVRATACRANFVAAVERFAQADRVFATTAEQWDPDPWLLGTPKGTVDLRTGELRDARRDDYITRVTAVAPAATVDCPAFLAFLTEATGGDRPLVGFLQRWFGYCLTGVTREHALLFVYGPGGNGKSVLVVAVGCILGDYAVTAAMDTFASMLGNRHTTDLAMLHGSRFVMTTETEEGQAWAESRIKALTGGDPITARFTHRDNFTFLPAFKLTISGNHKPALRNVDDAARRRFNIVPFLHKPARPDKELAEKLRAEWPGILRWMIEGCLDWQRQGLERPDVVRSATDAYFAEEDTVSQWLEECCELDPTHGETTGSLFSSWRNFAVAREEQPRSAKWLGTVLERRGLRREKDCSQFRGRGFLGIRVTVEQAAPRWQD